MEAKLEEYLQWGMRLMETHAARLRRIAPGHLLTEHPLREQSINALVDATLGWAYAHTDDPDFLHRSPAEVALYLLASRSALATAIELGKQAPPHLDYTPPPSDEYTPEELLLELAVGLVPLLGDGVDLKAFLSGYSLTGHRLSEPERFLSLLGAVLPFVHGRLLKEGGEAALGRVALVIGRSLDEVEVLFRVASHLGPEEVHEIERLLRSASAGHSFTQAELEFLNRVARRLETPLREAAQALNRGEKVAMLGSRTLSDGSRLLPGTPAHLAQCWVDYQFRHPGKYRRFSYAVDPEWERLYRTILANKPAGNAFEESILKKSGYTKNAAMMVPPPGSKILGFIPDSVPGNPGELVWGKPYSFVEAKARNELALTGNLKAMLDYVRECGGHLELWVRSAQHPAGATRFTQPLEKMLSDLEELGRVTVQPYP